MRVLALSAPLLLIARVCGSDGPPPPPTPPSASASVELEAAGAIEPRHGGSVVHVDSYAVEVVPRPSGHVHAYILTPEPPPPTTVDLAVNVRVREGGVRTVHLDWSPGPARYEAHVEGVAFAPGPANVVLAVDGQVMHGRVRHVAIGPRIDVRVDRGPPGHIPPGHARARGKGHWKGRGKGHRKHGHGHGGATVDVRVEGPAPPPPPSAEVRLEAGARVGH